MGKYLNTLLRKRKEKEEEGRVGRWIFSSVQLEGRKREEGEKRIL